MSRLYSSLQRERVTQEALALVGGTIGVDIATFDEVLEDGTVRLTVYPEREAPRVKRTTALFAAHLHEHPNLPAFKRREPFPVRVSDSVSLARYRRTGLYNEV